MSKREFPRPTFTARDIAEMIASGEFSPVRPGNNPMGFMVEPGTLQRLPGPADPWYILLVVVDNGRFELQIEAHHEGHKDFYSLDYTWSHKSQEWEFAHGEWVEPPVREVPWVSVEEQTLLFDRLIEAIKVFSCELHEASSGRVPEEIRDHFESAELLPTIGIRREARRTTVVSASRDRDAPGVFVHIFSEGPPTGLPSYAFFEYTGLIGSSGD